MMFLVLNAHNPDEFLDPVSYAVVDFDPKVMRLFLNQSKNIPTEVGCDIYSWYTSVVFWCSLIEIGDNELDLISKNGYVFCDNPTVLDEADTGPTWIEFHKVSPTWCRLKSYITDTGIDLWTDEFDLELVLS